MNGTVFHIQSNYSSTLPILHYQIESKILNKILSIVTQRLQQGREGKRERGGGGRKNKVTNIHALCILLHIVCVKGSVPSYQLHSSNDELARLYHNSNYPHQMLSDKYDRLPAY